VVSVAPTSQVYVASMLVLLMVKGTGRVVSLVNEIPYHESILGSGGIAPHISNLSTRWR